MDRCAAPNVSAVDLDDLEFADRDTVTRYLRILRALTRAEKRRVALLLVCSFLMSLIDVVGMSSILPFLSVAANPEIIGKNAVLTYLYGATGATSLADFVFILGLVALVTVIGSNLIAFVAQWAVIWYSFDLGRSLSRRLFLKYLNQPYQFFLRRNSFNLMLNSTGEVEGSVNGVLLPGMQIVAKATTALLLVLLVVLYNPYLAAIFIGVVGSAYALIFALTRRYVALFGERSHEANRTRYRNAKEVFGAIKELRILGRENYYADQFVHHNRAYGRNLALHSIIAIAPRYALETMGIGTMLIVILLNTNSERDLAAIIPTILLYAITGYRLMPAFQAIFSSLTVVKFNLPSLRILIGELSALSEVAAIPVQPQRAMELKRAISFVNASCRYAEGDEPALRDIDIVIPSCKTIGIVGASGAGKSTFVDVLAGLLPLETGQILIDDTPLTDGNVRLWRESIGYVAQQIYLADDTVRRNIALGIADADIDERLIESAARLASIHDFIVNEMPDRYDTVIGENGARLSGGQRQRLGIARALYRNPSVLVFDEATSALDGITEDAVIDAIKELSSQKTIVIIAHRFATVQHCDHIYLLDKGRIVDSGNYSQLLTRNNIFRQMAKIAK